MRCVGLAPSWLLSGILLSFILVPYRAAAADGESAVDSKAILQRQPPDEPARQLNVQPQTDSSTLEVAPQPQTVTPPPTASTDDATRSFRPSDDIAINKIPETEEPDEEHRAHLGVQLEYTTQCLMGGEVHGFEVVTVWPNSPAERAGLQARKPTTRIGELKEIGSLLAFPVALFTVPRLRRSGALGMPGDLIVAVNDRRVRTERELMSAFNALRAGDTVYLTVIRAIVGGGHQTLRIAVHTEEIPDRPEASRVP